MDEACGRVDGVSLYHQSQDELGPGLVDDSEQSQENRGRFEEPELIRAKDMLDSYTQALLDAQVSFHRPLFLWGKGRTRVDVSEFVARPIDACAQIRPCRPAQNLICRQAFCSPQSPTA